MKVYVQSLAGGYLMPTNPAKARFLLKKGKAKVVNRTPYTIQLQYLSDEKTQPITIGCDDGGIFVGLSAISKDQVLLQEEVILRTDIKGKMDSRRTYRRGRRNRKTRYRKPRFLNRTRPNGWLSPSIKSKKDAIVRAIVKMPLPKPSLIRLEDAYFDIQAMENPLIFGKQYQEGALLYEKNFKSAAKTRDGHQCRICKAKEELEVHHIKLVSKGGTDKLSNLMTLCKSCHWDHHNKGLKLPKQKNTFYTSAAHVQQGKKYLQAKLKKMAPLELTFGYITAHFRKKAEVEKSHVNDAVIIANRNTIPDPYFILTKNLEFRKRSLHEATARKGRKEKNQTQKRNKKNTFRIKGFQKLDTVRVFGKIGYISGFTGTSGAYVLDLEGKYITMPEKTYKQISLSKMILIHNNHGSVSFLKTCVAG
ncbi:MAG: hypothetical protein ACI86H_002224 [bacterium]|jgi:hypothetical protein